MTKCAKCGKQIGMFDTCICKTPEGNKITICTGCNKIEEAKIQKAFEEKRAEHEGPILMKAKGHDGQLELLETKIRILRESPLALVSQGLMAGNKEILIKQISSIQFRKADPLLNGYIQFAFLGGLDMKGGENRIMFTIWQRDDFDKIKDAIQKKMDSITRGETRPSSNLDELEKLADLKSKGIITEEEFNAKKKQLLGI